MSFSGPLRVSALTASLLVMFPPWQTRDEVARFVGYGSVLSPPTYSTTLENAAQILGEPEPVPIRLPDPPPYDPRLSRTENMMERHRVYNQASAMRLLASLRTEDVPARIAWRLLLIELLALSFVTSVVIGRRRAPKPSGRVRIGVSRYASTSDP